MSHRIGFFGGSFDPIHNGHLHLALRLFEEHKLDEIFFCPASQSPHKKHKPPQASRDDRRAMVTAAISSFPQFTLLDSELQKTDPCYTIDTIRSLVESDRSQKGEKVHYFLLLGDDTAASLPTWKEVDELLCIAKPLIGSREKDLSLISKELPASFASLLKKGWTEIPRLEISSTEIRQRVEKDQYAGYLVPGKVWDYIQIHQLYRKQK